MEGVNHLHITNINNYNSTITTMTDSHDSSTNPPFNRLVSEDTLYWFTLINYVILTGVVSLCGIVFNIINLIVFVKMGFKDAVNITLAGLSIADCASLFPLVWMSLCYNPLLVREFPQLDLRGIQHLTAGWPHVCFTRISSWLTALVTLERYLCVAFPLKVKTIITPKRTLVVVVAIFLIMMIGVIPMYVGLSLGPAQTGDNSSVISVIYSPKGQVLEGGSLSFAAFAQLSAFATVLLCTTGLVQKLQSKSKWRQETSSAAKNENTSMRDRAVVVMVIYIAAIFIVTYIPVVLSLIGMMASEDFGVQGRYSNFFLLSGTITFLLEAINSTMNIFVYLRMSTKFREVCTGMFSGVKVKK